ncbi:uncharacterized protein [Branchiostoma lanceolatum]|uniref:uncharacterized protein n=1 Tax=Branchiostoma lanceolatum TaxID=7740 RepID=UPI003455CEE3
MEYVEQLLRAVKDVNSDGSITAFIGLMTTGQDARYAWVDGSEVRFTYWRGRAPLPAGQNTESCALMLAGKTADSPETNWYTVPCNYPEATRSYICKAKARGCNRGWTMVGKSCLRTYTLPARSTNPARDSIRLCHREDSTVAAVNSSADVLLVQDYLEHMWPVHPYARVYMDIKYDETSTCGVLERRYDMNGDRWIVPKTECQFRRPNLVLCSMDVDASTCPSSCKCVNGVVSCLSKGLTSIPPKVPRTSRELYFTGNRLNLTKASLRTWGLLTTLDISDNSLTGIPAGAFSSLFKLRNLNISLNLISKLTAGTFDGLDNLEVLDLTGNNVHDVDVNVFLSLLNLRDLKTNQYKLCCLAPHTNACFAGHDHISSCEHLIKTQSLEITVWVLAIVSIMGNTVTLIHYIVQKSTQSSTFFCCNLAIADGLSGIYLIIISSANLYFKDRYFLEDQRWRSHIACSIAGGLIVFSKMASLTILVALFSDMYVVSRLITTRWKCICNVIMMTLCWLFALLCTILPMRFPLDEVKDEATSAACSPFVDIVRKQGRWRHWFVLLVALPTIMVVASIAIWGLCCFAEGFYRTKNTKKCVKHPESQWTMKLIIATNSISWLFVASVGMFCTTGDETVVVLVPWVVLFVVPLTSGLNPLIQLATITPSWFTRREVYAKKDEEGNSYTSGDQLRWRLHGASSCLAGHELGVVAKRENAEQMQLYLQCLENDVEPIHVTKVLLQFNKEGNALDEADITTEMNVLRRIGIAGSHQNVISQCAIADKDDYKWVLHTNRHHYTLREVATELTSEDLLTINLDVIKALNFLHRNDIVLGRMSLETLLVVKEPQLTVIVADFSNARIVEKESKHRKVFDSDFREWKKLKRVIERRSTSLALPSKLTFKKV